MHVKFKHDLNEELFGSVLYLYNELYLRLKPLFQRRMGSPDKRDEFGSEKIFFEYPEIAIVEALANFLIHRDYSLDDRGYITVYSDRIEFLNPGKSDIPIKELENVKFDLRPVYKRNQRLIEAMNKARINQAEGSGILRIKRELEKNRSFLPDGSLGLSIENDEIKNRFKLTLYKRIPESSIYIDGSTISIGTSKIIVRHGSAPPVPSLIIGRDSAIRDLKGHLILKTSTFPLNSNSQLITIIRGLPGVGKTTLAAYLAHDPDVVKSFPDGVLWTSLGPNPNILMELFTWGRVLGVEDIIKAHSIEEVSSQLTAFLQDKRILIIIDDVWTPEHAIPFKVGGRGCAMLLTTRLNSVAQSLAPKPSDIFRLSVLSDEESLELLSFLAKDIVQTYPKESLDLVHEIEGLPLALQVAGHLLNVEAGYGFGVSNLLNELREGTKLLEANAPSDRLDISNETIPTVSVLFQKSTDRLDPIARDCFAYLGVFAPKPSTFDLAAMAAVWQIDDPKPIVRQLVDRGLLEPVEGRFQMHPLLVMHAKSLLTED